MLRKEDINRKRLIAIDILRIVSVLIIFMFHSNIHIGISYGIFTSFISMGAIFMTAFFILSGFSIYYVNSDRDNFNSSYDIILFYKKRIISIIPAYWFIVIVYPIWDVFIMKSSRLVNIALFPIEILGIQSVFHSLFSFTHNGGTWFVSCILMCYFVFPLIFNLLFLMKRKVKIIFLVIFAFTLLYSPLLIGRIEIEQIYSNCFFRILEFIIGMLLCSFWKDIRDKKIYQILSNYFTMLFVFSILVTGVTFLVKRSIWLNDYMAYSVVALPCFCLLVFFAAGIDMEFMENKRIIDYLVHSSYVFFFAQFFTWKTTLKVISLMRKDGNLIRIIVSFAICSLITIFLHEIVEKPLKKVIKKLLILF